MSARLPVTGTVDGWPVMTVGALVEGAVAHRANTSPVYDGNGKLTKRLVQHPACMPAEAGEPTTTRAPRFPQVSVGWADHLGAVACTHAQCFPDAAS